MSLNVCRCCMARPPDKDLKAQYTRRGKTVVYGDLLKECFEIQIFLNESDDGGICELCEMKLADANDFKLQVQKCQKDMQMLASATPVKAETQTLIKQEATDDEDNDNDIYFLDLKEESDFEMREDADDDKNLAELFPESVKKDKKKTTVVKKKNEMKQESTEQLKTARKNIGKPIAKYLQNRHITVEEKLKANVDNILRFSNCTPFHNKTISGIDCAYCYKSLTNLDELRTHNTESHKKEVLTNKRKIVESKLSYKVDSTDLQCNICSKKIAHIPDLRQHLGKDHNIKFYSDIKDYIIEFKLTTNDVLSCALCDSTFETFKMLLQHMNRHYRNCICTVCDSGFVNKQKLALHQKTHEVGMVNCSLCEKVFSNKTKLFSHMRFSHNKNINKIKCPQCDNTFTSYRQRNIHMSSEHNTPGASYKCNICDKSFFLKNDLTSHTKRVHLMEKHFNCTICNMEFFAKMHLEEHMIKHGGEKIYKCTVCLKSYARKKTLREHLRIHQNDRRFKCGICGSTFVQKCSMKSHMHSNHGVTLEEYEISQAKVQKVTDN